MADWHLFKENGNRKLPIAIRYENDLLYMKFPFNQDMINRIKGIGMTAKKTNKGWIWRNEATRVFIGNFIELFPETAQVLTDYGILRPKQGAPGEIFWKPSPYLMDHQRSAAEIALVEPRYGFFHDTGCHAPGTKIIMSDGFLKKVEDVEVRDKLLGPDGNPRKTSGLYSGMDEMYRIVPVKGEPFTVNKDHILYLKRYRRRFNKPLYFEYICMSVKEYLDLLPTQKHNLKLCRASAINFNSSPIRKFQKDCLVIEPYFMGCLLGDGSLQRQIGITTMDSEIVDEICKQAGVFNLGIRKEAAGGKSSTYYFVSKHGNGPNAKNDIIKALYLLGLKGTNCGSKFIPDVYKYLDVPERLELLAGLIDTDGSKSSNSSYEYSSKSLKLSEDVAFISRSLGLASYLTEKIVNDTKYFRVSISGNVSRIPCKIPRKKTGERKQKKDPLVTGFSAEYVGRGEYYGFELDKDGLYLLDDFTITHNTGKTCTGIEIFKQKKVKTLVICPLSIIETAWMEDLDTFSPKTKACNLWKLFDKKKTKIGKRHLEMARDKFDLYLVNFESFKTNLDYINSLGIEMLQVDESSKIKNPKSLITKALQVFGDNVEYCYLFSGTPAPNNELEYWPQMRMIDVKLSGRSFYVFRAKYFYSFGFGNYSWKMKKEERQNFLNRLAEKTEVIKKQDVLNLPERTNNVRKVILTPKEMKAYKQMERNLYIEIEGKEVLAANSAVKIMKLREGSSGFYITETEVDVNEDEVRMEKEIIEVGNTKLKELDALLDEIGNNQVIIWNHFHYEADKITELLEKKGKGFVRVDGTVKKQATKDERTSRFKQGKVQYLVAHPASVGHGNTFIKGNYAIYFSLCHSYELFKQSRDRIYRKGQVNKCTYYYLCAQGTVDLVILNGSLAGKAKLVNGVFRYLKHLQDGGHPDDFREDNDGDGDDSDRRNGINNSAGPDVRGRITPEPEGRENFWEQPADRTE